MLELTSFMAYWLAVSCVVTVVRGAIRIFMKCPARPIPPDVWLSQNMVLWLLHVPPAVWFVAQYIGG